MKKIVFATSNKNKIREVAEMLSGRYEVIPMADIGCTEDIPETSETFEGNAILKAKYLKDHYNFDCFAEDSGLEIDALDGAPGVRTARYGGMPQDPIRNMTLVLGNIKGVENRNARFRTAIALLIDDEEHVFEGTVEGRIANKMQGNQGFGYDPIFIPKGYDKTFGELDSSIKKSISHRARAVAKLIAFLQKRP
jgi:XTP/dITP diphosphohydrolase